eukprot:TRINITY_DN92772_c0_g1_i1.p1 TRINITY_DN92772_c0_g1~~TRINITY_DN92772_c0_g1_i1.p1  ORF type:complete len:235 (-),score=23.03 TRINITY_DN92772_c0_g1_i1:4-708(-)
MSPALLEIFQEGCVDAYSYSEMHIRNIHHTPVDLSICDNFGHGEFLRTHLASGETYRAGVIDLEDFDFSEAIAGFYPQSCLQLHANEACDGGTCRVYGSAFQDKIVVCIKAWTSASGECNHEAWSVRFDSFRRSAKATCSQEWVPPGPAVYISGAEAVNNALLNLRCSLLSTRIDLQLRSEALPCDLVAELRRRGYEHAAIVGPDGQKWTGFGADPKISSSSLLSLLNAVLTFA